MRALLLAAFLALAPAIALAQGITSFFPGPGSPASSGAAATAQVITSNTNAASVSVGGERFYVLGSSITATASVYPDTGVVAAAGSLGKFRCWIGVAVSGAQTWVCKLYKNGVASTATCTISTSSLTTQSCVDSVNTVSVSPNDTLGWSVTPGATAGTAAVASAAAEFTPTTANDTIILGGNLLNQWDTTNTLFVPGFGQRPSGTEGGVTAFFPASGTIDKLYIRNTTALSGASTRTFTLRSNAADTTVTCQVAVAADTKLCNDTTHSGSVTAGQEVALKQVPASTPTATNGGFGFRFVPTTSGNFIFQSNTIAAGESVSATNFILVNGQQNANATEANVQEVVGAMTVTAMYVRNVTAPAAGKSRLYTLRANGVDTAATCTISNTSTSCSWTGTVSVSANDLLAVSTVPSGTPTTSQGTSIGISAHQ